jgi:hypothetical protein
MTDLIRQRTPHQCAIATVAMATGWDYDEVLDAGLSSGGFTEDEGCRHYSKMLEALGYSYRFVNGEPVGDFVVLSRAYAISAEFFRSQAWGRRAILSVPSLAKPGGWHSVYWDGRQVFDPNLPGHKLYAGFDELLPSEMVLFREAA